MGTRADFYIGRGENAEWLGSIAWDGYPDGVSHPEYGGAELLKAKTEKEFRKLVKKFLESRDDATFPENGWPWPWETSGLTDYSYWFNENEVLVSRFGRKLLNLETLAEEEKKEEESEYEYEIPKTDETFPNMKDRQNVRWDKGSGIILIQK